MEISRRMPLPEQAPAARPAEAKMVMSWHWLVTEVVWVLSPWLPPFQRPSIAPDWTSVKMRGLETILASSGWASGTLMMSMRKRAVSGVLIGVAADAAGEFLGLTDGAGAGDVDVDVFLVVGRDEEGVGVGTAATLDGGNLFRVGEV